MDNRPQLSPVALSGLTWKQAERALRAVDCALRRPHWCDPVVVLIDGKLMLDSGDDMYLLRHMRGDKSASDWSMVPRVDDDGNEIPMTYRAAHQGAGE